MVLKGSVLGAWADRPSPRPGISWGVENFGLAIYLMFHFEESCTTLIRKTIIKIKYFYSTSNNN